MISRVTTLIRQVIVIKKTGGNGQYSLVRITMSDIVRNDYCINIDHREEVKRNYIIEQGDSLLLDQVQRLRGYYTRHIRELILVEARRNPKKEEQLRKLLADGFDYNGQHYVRFGKSSSQAKSGITVFVDARYYDELMKITMLDMEIDECVISKYESQRCLVFSTCKLIEGKIPYIVVVDEYKKSIPDQHIKFISEEDAEFTDPETGKIKKYRSRVVNDDIRDIPLSPFDGCGCHSHEVSQRISEAHGLDYIAIGAQIRLPFFKGYSVEFPFKEYYAERGIEYITDAFGQRHRVEDIDCIWNTSMFKGFGLFKKKYGADGWLEYMNVINKYQFKLGVSKYSHHTKNIKLKARMNYQYLQCLDLWNPKYAERFNKTGDERYDILDPNNDGAIVKLARYTSNLFENIIKGDKFYSYKFMGIGNTDTYSPLGRYLEAVLINDAMFEDAAIRTYLHAKLSKYINEAKVGKIYADGFYHTVVGDMIGYLEYAAELEPVGCLGAGEFFCNTIPKGPVLSFRSPLICPSEVNDVTVVENDVTRKWFGHFKEQDVVMINMYDISMPRQGGMDADGDSVFLCHDPLIVDKKIHKTMIIDVDDKVSAQSKPYTPEAIIEYELNSRDNRIGEITNVATSILNKKAASPEGEKQYADYISLLRILQGKEIDFLKTGVRWHMPKRLRQHIKVLPFFLMYIYPKKMQVYKYRQKVNKENPEAALPYNAYHSPSPLNELCDYISTWELRKILWADKVSNTRDLVINHSLDLDDEQLLRKARRMINDFTSDLRNAIEYSNDHHIDVDSDLFDPLYEAYDKNINELCEECGLDRVIVDNYIIKASYRNNSVNRRLAWSVCGNTLIENLKANSPTKTKTVITEVPCKSETSYEYLGKYYEMSEEVFDVRD